MPNYSITQLMRDIAPMRAKLNLPQFQKVDDNTYETPVVENKSMFIQLPTHKQNDYHREAYRIGYTQYGYKNDSRLIGYSWNKAKSVSLAKEFAKSVIPEDREV